MCSNPNQPFHILVFQNHKINYLLITMGTIDFAMQFIKVHAINKGLQIFTAEIPKPIK